MLKTSLKARARAFLEGKAQTLCASLTPGTLLVGLSGGADSTLALLLALEMVKGDPRFSVRAVHCIHGLDADDPLWLKHCTALCERLQVPLVTPRLNIVYQNRVSPEDSSRQERYRALLEELPEDGYLVLGHQADDNVEGLFLALKRGSGPKGLAGMSELTRDERGCIVRPLLSLTKKECQDYVTALDFDYVEDISNTYLKFERNFIRLEVLPLLLRRFPSFKQTARRSMELIASEHELALRLVTPLLKARVHQGGRVLDCEDLDLADRPLMELLLLEFLKGVRLPPPDLTLVQQCLKLLSTGPDQKGELDWEDLRVRRAASSLWVLKEVTLPSKGAAPVTLRTGEECRLGGVRYALVTLKEGTQEQSAPFSLGRSVAFTLPAPEVSLDFAFAGALHLKPWWRDRGREVKKLLALCGVPWWYRPAYPLVRDVTGKIVALGSLFTPEEPPVTGERYVLVIEDTVNGLQL